MERRLSAVLMADVVGYSRMVGANEGDALRRVRRWRDEVLEVAVRRSAGRLVKLMGDGALAVFASAFDAATCAIALQTMTAEREALEPEDRRIVLRIGVNLGDVVEEDGDIFGDGVNIAARLESMARPGGVLVSHSVWESVAGRIEVTFHDNGERRFKNIARTIRVWSWPDKLAAVTGAAKPRVHVERLAGETPEERRLADDLADELRAQFARLTGLEVAAGPADARYRVEGGVRLAPGRCRVYGRLVAVDSARQIWADRHDRPSDDPFEILDHCAPRMAMSIRRRVAADDAERLRGRPLDELSLDELLSLAGVSFFNPTREGWEGGGLLAEQALQIEPGSFMALAMAAAGLGLVEPLYGHRAPAPEAVALASRRIEAALRLNGRSDMLHVTSAGLLLFGRGRHREAAAAVRRSLEINPDYNMGFWMLSAVQLCSGDPEAAARNAVRAVEIEVNDPYVHLYDRIVGLAHLGAGRPEEAADWLRRADALAPGLPPNLIPLAVALHRAGDAAGARDALDALTGATPDFRLADLHPLPYADTAEWRRFEADLQRLAS